MTQARAPSTGIVDANETIMRDKYFEKLTAVLPRVDGLAIVHAQNSSDPRAVLMLTAGGLRARMLNSRLRSRRAFAA